MNNVSTKIRSFIDLNAWKEGHELVLMIYKTTDSFPRKEDYSLTSQMRRCAVSITSNIAEGFGRRSYKDKVKFYYISLGSVDELQNQLLVARDVKYLNREIFNSVLHQTIKVHKLVNGLIKSSKYLIHNS